MPDVTIIIPVAEYHKSLLDRAVRSANEQTHPCEVFVYEDTEMRGAGYSRNKALAEVTTDFCVFLDADDQIAPMFVERCMSVWKPRHYVYTDWVQDTNVITASKHPWQADNGEWHVITTLLRTEDVRRVGGFDEIVKGGEDTLMWWALTRSGVCGIALHEPLFTYGKEGRRAKEFVNSPEYRPTLLGLIERYGDAMCCGGENPIQSFVPDQPGDVLAQAQWGGNMRKLGTISGRLYKRSSWPNTMSVDPRDVDASPELWQRVRPPAPEPVKPAQIPVAPRPVLQDDTKVWDSVESLAKAAYGLKVVNTNEVLTAEQLKATLPAGEKTAKPNVSKVRRLAKGKK